MTDTDRIPEKPNDAACRDALAHVLASDRFARADRLKSFLTYIVEEALAGRGDLIRGKTIAMDVYGRDPSRSGRSENVVRVDARRLRRSLNEYYASDGKDDDMRIWVDSGGYVPRFEPARTDQPQSPPAQNRKPLIYSALAVLVAGLAVTAYFAYPSQRPSFAPDPKIVLERRALREKSTATLQAANLAEQARGFLFPLLDPERQRIATDMFRQAIRLDPEYFGGYAGAAQTLATLSKIQPAGPTREDTLTQALQMSETALKFNPTDAWAQSAAGWVAFAHKDYDRAIKLSRRAAQLAPDDGYILDFHAVVSILTGDFEEARKASDPARPHRFSKRRLANRNIFGVANFHLARYDEAIASFSRAAELGDPVSVLSLLYLATSHQAAGNTVRATELIREMKTTWPGFNPEIALPEFYQHREHVDQILDLLRAAGWVADH